jgi:NAD(P)-dependent dehydrogenase (short-subunit alcohol dehydrogenase family)
VREQLEGQVALFTGPMTPLAVAAARRLGNAGVFLAFAGNSVSDDPDLQPLLCQFRRTARCIETPLQTVEHMEQAISEAERLFGRMDILIHTLGGERPAAAEMRGSALVWNASAPLIRALVCSSGAIRHMARRRHGHVVHLVPRGDVGAAEVERLVQSRLEQAWRADGAPGNVALSAIYCEGIRPLLTPLVAPDRRLLETFTGRVVEEEDWAERLFQERELGEMIVRVCSQDYGDAPGEVHSFEISGFAGEPPLALPQ